MNKIKVMILHAPTGIGGAEGVILNINRFVNPDKILLFNCPFINFTRGQSDYLEELKSKKIQCYPIPLIRRFEYRYISAVREFISKNQIDLIHSHGYRSDIIALIASWGSIPVVSTLHGYTANSVKVRLYEFMQRMVRKKIKMILPVSILIEQQLREEGIPSSKIHLLPNVVDNTKMDQAESISIFPVTKDEFQPLKIVFVGRLSPEKGLDALFKISEILLQKKFPFSLLIVGEGPLREKYEKESKIRGLVDNIKFLGFRSDVANIISSADVFVLTSKTEGVPLVILEAMAMGKPVVSFRVGGIPQLIPSDEVGCLVEPENIDAFVKALIWVRENPKLSKKMGEKAKQYVNSQFDPMKWANELENIYYNVISR